MIPVSMRSTREWERLAAASMLRSWMRRRVSRDQSRRDAMERQQGLLAAHVRAMHEARPHEDCLACRGRRA